MSGFQSIRQASTWNKCGSLMKKGWIGSKWRVKPWFLASTNARHCVIPCLQPKRCSFQVRALLIGIDWSILMLLSLVWAGDMVKVYRTTGDIVVEKGNDFLLSCYTTGISQPRATWFKVCLTWSYFIQLLLWGIEISGWCWGGRWCCFQQQIWIIAPYSIRRYG